MSKLTDIKYRINQLDGGAFQNLCDAYLSRKGYENGYSLGMASGTDKTAKGNPDTYFLTSDGQFVFVMYTTQKDSFVQKLWEDIKKCLDSEKTGLVPEHIAEIIYCHTYGRLSAGEHKNLLDFCQERGVALKLIGMDELGLDLYTKYPHIAKDFLGVSVDTGQINSICDFIALHDKSNMSAPLNTEFMFRESELESAETKLTKSNLLVITGPAGTGKTRLALKLCESFSAKHKYEVLCIRSNGLELYDNLLAAIEPDRDYLVFVDDANELAGLHFVLDYLSRETIGKKYIKKIIITVRDYAQRQVVEQILKFEKPEFIKIGPLKDGQIKSLLEKSFEITNPFYLNHIAVIAEGNARLAMLAGKIAASEDTLESIRDASELYNTYYGDQIHSITDSKTGLISAGILAFFQTLHLDHLDPLDSIFSAFKISKDEFISDLRQLHNQELVDLCQDKAAKISDQSFSNYLIKYVFFDQKLIPFSQMIEHGFFINKLRTISACEILLNVFSGEPLQEYIEQQIIIVWEHLQTDAEKFPSFFEAFHMVRPTETLILLKDQIDRESKRSFDIHSIVFDKRKSEASINDDIIKILCNFDNHPQLPEAIDLLLLYYQKRPDLFEQIYSAIACHFGVNQYSCYYNYDTQTLIVERLNTAVQSNPCDENFILFVRTAEEFLKLSFSRTEPGRKSSITFYTMPLVADPPVIKYRRSLLEQLLDLYKKGNCQKDIESFLKDYCREYRGDVCHELIKEEFDLILQFFPLLSTDNLYHCVIAKHIQAVARHIGYDCRDKLSEFLTSSKCKIYDSLNVDYFEDLSQDFEHRTDRHKERVCKLVQQYDPSEFQYLFQVCNESLKIENQNNWSLSRGIEFAIDSFSRSKTSYISIIKEYMSADTPYNIRPDIILQNLFHMMPAEEVKTLLLSVSFAQQNTWLWYFYAELPKEKISPMWAADLLLYLQTPKKNLGSSPFRPLEEIKKYEIVDKNIILKASRIIVEHYEESPFVFGLYFLTMLPPYQENTSETINCYKDNIILLEEIYLKCVALPDRVDAEGSILSEIVKQDSDFLNRYLDEFLEQTSPYIDCNNIWLNRLSFAWKEETFLECMDTILIYLEEKLKMKRIRYSSVLNQLLTPKNGDTDTASRQELWIQTTIQKYYLDEHHMCTLFEGIAEQGEDRRLNALKSLLSLNSSYELFEKLPLQSSICGGWGSMIPSIQRKIDYLNAILPILTGTTFLKHRRKVEKDIEMWKIDIKRTEIRELLESFF